MEITEIDVLRALESDGSVWAEYFVLNSLVIARRNTKGTLMAKLIEDNKLFGATKAFSSHMGTRSQRLKTCHQLRNSCDSLDFVRPEAVIARILLIIIFMPFYI